MKNNPTSAALRGVLVTLIMAAAVSIVLDMAWTMNPGAALLVVFLIVAGASGGYYAHEQGNIN